MDNHSLLTLVADKKIATILTSTAQEQQKIFSLYLQNYNRKLQLLDAFSQEWNKGKIDRLKEIMQELTNIDLAQNTSISQEEKTIFQIINELKQLIKKELDKRKNKTESKLYQKFKSFQSKLNILEKNISLQLKWFDNNKTILEKNKNKSQLISLIRREGDVLFDINSTDFKEIILQINTLLEEHNLTTLPANTADYCEQELQKELLEFEKDRPDESITSITPLKGGFVNYVVLVKTNNQCEYVAKAFKKAGDFKLSLRGRKLVTAAGGLVAPVIRLSKNEIICEKIHGQAVSDILLSQPTLASHAFHTFGRSVAIIHKNTLQEMSLYNPRAIFQHKYTADYENIRKKMKSFQTWKVINKKMYADFIAARKKYYPSYLSTILSDVNLSNYFYVENPDTVIVIDSDYVKIGDPLTDIGRLTSSIRYQCFRAKLTPIYANQIVNSFLAGYKSVLNIELRGMDLYHVIIYSIIIYSAKRLIDKVTQLIQTNNEFAQQIPTPEYFFQGNFQKVSSYFDPREINKAQEVQYSLEQITLFINGKNVNPQLAAFKKAA